MANVFISYVHSDADKVEHFVKALNAVDIVGWHDQADISAGDSFASAVREGLKRASAVIVLLSPGALHSEWVQFEIGAAEALDKKIIPVLLSGDHIEETLPDILKDRKWLDARHRPYEDVVRDIKRAVESAE
jgi:hypothetical protein